VEYGRSTGNIPSGNGVSDHTDNLVLDALRALRKLAEK